MTGEATHKERARALLAAYHTEVASGPYGWHLKPISEYASARVIMEADPQTQVALIIIMLPFYQQKPGIWSEISTFYAELPDYRYHQVCRINEALIVALCRRNLPYTLGDVQQILQVLSAAHPFYSMPYQSLLRSFVRILADPEMLSSCRPQLEALRTAASDRYDSADKRKFLKLLDDILSGQQKQPFVIRPDDWGTRVNTLHAEMETETDLYEHWIALLSCCATAKGSEPANKWLVQAQRLMGELGQENFCRLATGWIGAFGKGQGSAVDEDNANLLKGLAWCCVGVEDRALASVLADAAISGYRKITGVGPRSAKVASACVYALKNMGGLHGAAQLERVRLNVKQPTYRAGLEKALDEAALLAGMSREDLEELTVPTFGLDKERLRVSIGSATADLQIVGLSVQIQWYDAKGNPRKAEPAEVKREHKAELKDLKRFSDDITSMLGAQRDRIERLPLAERTWSLSTWRERYIDHPLVGCIARRLLWRFSDGERTVDAIYFDGQLVDAHDRPLELTETTTVSPWHPVLCEADVILEWRNWLERHQVTQPFKQAHREVYLLTDAERTTRVYSNRFAAHILRQHQFNALAAARGWRNQLRLMVDDTYPPATLELPRHGLRAEFWIEGAGETYGEDTNETGTYLRVATDQVRFYAINAHANSAHATGGGYHPAYAWQRQPSLEDEPIPLEQIPPLVLSEVLRDVDLFVGVASVGNDPTWQDGGPDGRYQNYWHSYSFGELSATAETRRQLLSRLIPRLTIADRCTIDGRFLKVRGDLRTYKIHMGSGNILMEPNDQYLCIVPKSGGAQPATGPIFLPFEGDTLFSIILSKAFLLADDRKITDVTITRQIGKVGDVATVAD